MRFDRGGPISYGGLDECADEDGSNKFLDATGVPTDLKRKMIFVPQQRSRINVVGIITNIFCPWLLFTAVYALVSFKIHYFNPNLTWCLVFAAFCVCAITASIAYTRKLDDKDPSWYTYLTGAFLFGCTCATVFGNIIFFEDTIHYYDYMTLNTYSSINPAHETGQMVMDSGRVYFAHDVGIDFKKSAAFKHGDVYCVAPITHNVEELRTYDFWAVGKNCCENPHKFHCGADVENFRARSGLRLMNEDQHPFYQLAVQQAEAAYGITAAHPVFFHWTQDPLKDIHMYMHNAIRRFLIGTVTYFIGNFACVIAATFAFAKMGRV